MMTLIAAALVAAAQAAPAQPADSRAHQHGHQGHHGQHGPAEHKGMECCKHHSADHKMDCCKGMADAAKAKGCCAEHGKGDTQGQHQHR